MVSKSPVQSVGSGAVRISSWRGKRQQKARTWDRWSRTLEPLQGTFECSVCLNQDQREGEKESTIFIISHDHKSKNIEREKDIENEVSPAISNIQRHNKLSDAISKRVCLIRIQTIYQNISSKIFVHHVLPEGKLWVCSLERLRGGPVMLLTQFNWTHFKQKDGFQHSRSTRV